MDRNLAKKATRWLGYAATAALLIVMLAIAVPTLGELVDSDPLQPPTAAVTHLDHRLATRGKQGDDHGPEHLADPSRLHGGKPTFSVHPKNRKAGPRPRSRADRRRRSGKPASPAEGTSAGVGAGSRRSRQRPPQTLKDGPAPRGGAVAGKTPASTAKIGSTPAAPAAATAQAKTLSNDNATGAVNGAGAEGKPALTSPPAPKAAKRVARHFAEAFVVYETGGADAKVRSSFRRTTTKQLAKALLQRPPRQPAAVKVPQAKVVTVVAGPSKGSVYEVSVSLLRVGVTSELRLAMEQGPGKQWQVTNVLG